MDDIVKVLTAEPSVLHISLNRPDRLNALNRELMQRLALLFDEAKHDTSVKVILLTGQGKAFCAGADIKQLANLNGPDGLAFSREGQAVFRRLELLGKPSIAAIHGYAFGGGCELAMAATIRIATDTTLFGQPEIKLGIIPGFGGTQRLARLIGKGRALDLCLSGRQFSAAEAHQWGLVTELASSPENLLMRANAITKELAALGPLAMQSILTTIHQGYDMSLEEGSELEAAHFGLCCTTADKREGVSAFLEKRTAVFGGE
jgi:enoyl-CoA hydratase